MTLFPKPLWTDRRSRQLLLLALAAVFSIATGLSADAIRNVEGSITHDIEIERKSCTNCEDEPSSYDVETTPIELVIRPVNRPDLSFGLEFGHDIESENAFFGPDRTDVETTNELELWARRDFNEMYWGRVQTELNMSHDLIDIGARAGFGLDLSETRELSGYLEVYRRLSFDDGDPADEGTFVEARLEHQWDFDDFGAYVELRANRFFLDSDDDQSRMSVEPGLSFDLGNSPHKGDIWLELERRTRSGPSDFTRDTGLIGLGVEFDIKKRRELFVGVRFGKEREREVGEPTKTSKIGGVIVEFSRSF